MSTAKVATTRHEKLPETFTEHHAEWGCAPDHDLYDWHQQIEYDPAPRRNGSIVLLDRRGQQQMRWNFVKGVVKWTGPSQRKSNDVAIETLELAHE
jgi:phage tail-like protein